MVRRAIPTSDPSARTEDVGALKDAQAPTRQPLTPQTPANAPEHPGLVSSADGRIAPPPAPLPSEYRGKSSGEFQRVVVSAAPDAASLVAEAERHLVTLPSSDRNRRLLEVAILRRDTALLNGLLADYRRKGR